MSVSSSGVMSILLFVIVCVLIFFMQKTAYDMRISDWSSDVFSSDLPWHMAGCSRALRGSLARIDQAARRRSCEERAPDCLGRVAGSRHFGLGRPRSPCGDSAAACRQTRASTSQQDARIAVHDLAA